MTGAVEFMQRLHNYCPYFRSLPKRNDTIDTKRRLETIAGELFIKQENEVIATFDLNKMGKFDFSFNLGGVGSQPFSKTDKVSDFGMAPY